MKDMKITLKKKKKKTYQRNFEKPAWLSEWHPVEKRNLKIKLKNCSIFSPKEPRSARSVYEVLSALEVETYMVQK